MSLRTPPTDTPLSRHPTDNLRTPRTREPKTLVTPTDSPTDTTDTTAYGHDWGGYIPPVGPAGCPSCESHRILPGPYYQRTSLRCCHCGNVWTGSEEDARALLAHEPGEQRSAVRTPTRTGRDAA